MHTLITNWSAHFSPSQSVRGVCFVCTANFPISLLRSMRDLLIAIIFLSNGNNRCFSTWWFLFNYNFYCVRVVSAHARIDHLFAPRRSLYTRHSCIKFGLFFSYFFIVGFNFINSATMCKSVMNIWCCGRGAKKGETKWVAPAASNPCRKLNQNWKLKWREKNPLHQSWNFSKNKTTLGTA